METNNIITVTTDNIPGREIVETIGMVRGNSVRARHIGSDIGASLKGLVGGEIRGYVKVMSAAREEAVNRMKEEAVGLDADAIVATRFTTSQIMDGSSEVLVYGTAVRLR